MNMKHATTAIVYSLLGAIMGSVAMLLLQNSNETDVLQKINNDYATLLSTVFSLILIIITSVYVMLTHTQAKSAQESVRISQDYLAHAEKQLMHSRVPMLVAKITKAQGCAYFGQRRRQLGIDWEINNIGDGPAVQIYTRMKLRYSHAEFEDYDELYEHSFIGSLAPSETTAAHMHFETTKIEKMIEDFEIKKAKNMARIKVNPRQSAHRGPLLELEILYSNVHGQYFKSLYHIPLGCLKVDSREDEQEKMVYWLADKPLQDDEAFEVHQINPVFSTFHFQAVDHSEGEAIIERYRQLI